MAQHWLYSPGAVTLTNDEIGDMSEIDAEERFVRLRWFDNKGKPQCPYCADQTTIYTCRRRHRERSTGASRYRCKSCGKDFSATTGTLFAWHKKSFKQMLFAILAFVNEVKGKASLAMRREVRGHYKTRWVFSHKLRAAIWKETAHLRTGPPQIGGPGKVVQIDGVRVGGSFRKPNRRDQRVDRRLKKNRSDKIRSIVAIRECPRRNSGEDGVTIVRVFKHELDAIPWLLSCIIPGTTVHTDEGGWNDLQSQVIWRSVNHKRMYWDKGVSTNAAEWLFNRLRRGVRGHYHRIIGDYFDRHGRKIGDYLGRYGQEMAWRDDHRRLHNGGQVDTIIRLMMQTPRSPDSFGGYWQRHKRPKP
jgi:transposase-like protein